MAQIRANFRHKMTKGGFADCRHNFVRFKVPKRMMRNDGTRPTHPSAPFEHNAPEAEFLPERTPTTFNKLFISNSRTDWGAVDAQNSLVC